MAFLSSLRSIVKHTKSRHHSDHQKVFKLDFKKDEYTAQNIVWKISLTLHLTHFDSGGCKLFTGAINPLLATDIPELQAVVGADNVDEFRNTVATPNVTTEATTAALQKCFTALMTCDVTALHIQLKNLVQRAGNLQDRWFASFCIRRSH